MRRALLLVLLALILAGAATVVLFPLATAIGLAGAPVRGDASGTVWDGRVEDAAVDGVPLGELGVRTHFLPLLTGTRRATLTVDGPGGAGSALVEAAGDGVLVRTAEGTLDLAGLGLRSPLGTALDGTAAVEGRGLVLTPSGCATGTVAASTDALRGLAALAGGQGFDLSGEGACEDGVLVLPMTGRGAGGAAELLIRVTPGLPSRYAVETTLRPADPRLGAALRAYGFREGPSGYSLTARGTF